MKFTVPGEPTGKGRPRVVKNGAFTRTYTPEKTASYENLVKLEYQQQSKGVTFGGKQIKMDIKAYYALAKSDSKRRRSEKISGARRPTKKPDIDNVYKIVADALNKIAYDDDSQIVAASIEKYYAEQPRVEITIEEVRQQFPWECWSAQDGPTASVQIKNLRGGTEP